MEASCLSIVSQFPHVEVDARHNLQQAHVVQAAGGNFAADHDFGPAKKYPWKYTKPMSRAC